MDFRDIVFKEPVLNIKPSNFNNFSNKLILNYFEIPISERRLEKNKKSESLSWLSRSKLLPLSEYDTNFSSSILFDIDLMSDLNNKLIDINDYNSNLEQVTQFYFNEIEFSGEAFFKKPLMKNNDGTDFKPFKRYYFNYDDFVVYINNDKILTKPFKDSISLVLPRVSIRFDDYGEGFLINSTKIVHNKKKFNVDNFDVKLKTSYECKLFEFSYNGINLASKAYNIHKWSIKSIYGKPYTFVIAFKQNCIYDNEVYELNIECEEPISLKDFTKCYHALYTYYNYQYLNQNYTIYPKTSNYEAFQKSICFNRLDSEQKNFLNQIIVVSFEKPTDFMRVDEDYRVNPLLDQFWIFTSLKHLFETNVDDPVSKEKLYVNKHLFDNLKFETEFGLETINKSKSVDDYISEDDEDEKLEKKHERLIDESKYLINDSEMFDEVNETKPIAELHETISDVEDY